MSGESADGREGDHAGPDAIPRDWPPSSIADAADAASSPEEPPRPPNEVTALSDESSAIDPTATSTGTGSSSGQDAGVDAVAGRVAEGGPRVGEDLLEDHSFALCLTHDVDRPYKVVQAMFYALRDRDPAQLLDLLPGREPNWTFDRLLAIEEELGVRSAFYFLQEQRLFRDRPLRDWLNLDAWRLYADRYSISDPDVVDLIYRLDGAGWEVGLHGSYESYDDRERLREEKQRLEAVLGKEVLGGRQHYLNRTLPDTWEHHAALDLRYDATLGSSTEIGFDYGDTIARPFDDQFVTFPLTMMDVAMPDPSENPAAARDACDRILLEAADRGAIATVLWHPRVFNDGDWPGHADLYRYLIERAQELGAWVGAPGECYAKLDHPE